MGTDRAPGLPGHRRRHADRQLHRDHRRRLPRRPARVRARRQPGGRAGRLVPRPDHRRTALRVALARGVLGQRAGGVVGHLDGLPAPARQASRPDQEGHHRLVGQPDLRARADRPAGRHHLRAAAVRRAHHGLDQPDGVGRPRPRCADAGGVRGDREPGPRTHDQHEVVQDPRVHRGEHREPAGLDGPGWPAVHPDHLVAGHLAAVAGLRVRPDPTLGRHLHAAADDRVPGGGPDLRRTVRPVRRPGVSPPGGCSSKPPASSA